MTRSSGRSTDGNKFASSPTGSGIRKSSPKMKRKSRVRQATESGGSARDEKKWQALFDSAREVSADSETVRALRDKVLTDTASKKNGTEKQSSFADAAECSDHGMISLIEQIYRDLHNVAAAQISKATSEEAQAERTVLGELTGELTERDLLLQDLSSRVRNVISKSLYLHTASAHIC